MWLWQMRPLAVSSGKEAPILLTSLTAGPDRCATWLRTWVQWAAGLYLNEHRSNERDAVTFSLLPTFPVRCALARSCVSGLCSTQKLDFVSEQEALWTRWSLIRAQPLCRAHVHTCTQKATECGTWQFTCPFTSPSHSGCYPVEETQSPLLLLGAVSVLLPTGKWVLTASTASGSSDYSTGSRTWVWISVLMLPRGTTWTSYSIFWTSVWTSVSHAGSWAQAETDRSSAGQSPLNGRNSYLQQLLSITINRIFPITFLKRVGRSGK